MRGLINMNGIFRQQLLSCLGFLLFLLLFSSCKENEEESAVTHFPFRITSGGNWGLLRADGHIGVAPVFENAPSVVVNRLFSLPDTCGRLLLYKLTDEEVPVRLGAELYTQLGYFFGERTLAQKEPGAPFCILDREGQWVAELEEDSENRIEMAHNFSEGLALVRLHDGKYGYVDESGKRVIPPRYDFASDFSDGLAIVGLSDKEGRMTYQLIDKRGKVHCPVRLQNCDLTGTLMDGRLAYKDRMNRRCALLERDGETALTFSEKIKEILPSPYGVTLFLDENGVGLADEKGTVVIPGSYERGKIVGENRVAFRLHGKWGILDFSGRALMEFNYDSLSVFYDKEHAWAYKDGVWRVIGKDGKIQTSEVYPNVVMDKRTEGKVPQVLYRNPPERKLLTGIEATEDSCAADAQASVPESLPVGRAEMQSESRENPFFEEAQKVYAGKLDEPDAERRKVILEYVERFRSAYTQKDLAFIEQVFSEEALIVVGKVVKAQRNVEGNYLSAPEVQYNVKSKKEYLARLKEVFRANRKIQVHFQDFKIMRHPTRENFYGVTMRQGYSSDIYSDDGYLFLLWDFSDDKAPKIHVRTWQPSMLDTNTPLPADKVFSIRNFNFE